MAQLAQIDTAISNNDPEPGWGDTSDMEGPGAVPVIEVDQEDLDDDGEERDEEEAEIDENQTIIVDVVIIRTEENYTTSKGVNLLQGLSVVLGDDDEDFINLNLTKKSSDSTNTRILETIISIPALTYSLNIANANDQRNEILARPTLTAMNGETSEFFSGVNINAAVLPSTSGGTGDSVTFEIEVGVKLEITPELLDDGRIKIDVVAERQFLNSPNANVTGFTSKIETTRTTVHAVVAMNFDESLILSGLSEKETEDTRDGVPFLQEIPIIQYLFSKETTLDYNKSVLILITPRKAEYIYEQGTEGNTKLGNNNALGEFRARYADWFRPYPTWASIFNHLQDSTLYREFRTGDVTMERWETNEDLSVRLKKAMKFLYY